MSSEIITGELNQRILIMKKTVSTDEIGNQFESWTDFYKCWSAVNGLSGREYWQAKEQHQEDTANFKIRYCKKLNEINTHDFKIIFKEKSYDIQSVDNVFFADNLVNIKAVVSK